jgi:hypothetical protein
VDLIVSEHQQEQIETFDPREVQALHRRLLAAKDRGEAPTAEDLDMKRRVMASPYALRDRAWARDEN